MLAEFDYYEFFSDEGRLGIMMALVVSIGVMGIIAYWQLAAKRMECDLKQRLAERGFSANEIERIVCARGKDDDDTEHAALSRPPHAGRAHQLH